MKPLSNDFLGSHIPEGLPVTKPFSTDDPHTFKEWREHGYGVWKGEKHTGMNENREATFKPIQVVSLERLKTIRESRRGKDMGWWDLEF